MNKGFRRCMTLILTIALLAAQSVNITFGAEVGEEPSNPSLEASLEDTEETLSDSRAAEPEAVEAVEESPMENNAEAVTEEKTTAKEEALPGESGNSEASEVQNGGGWRTTK